MLSRRHGLILEVSSDPTPDGRRINKEGHGDGFQDSRERLPGGANAQPAGIAVGVQDKPSFFSGLGPCGSCLAYVLAETQPQYCIDVRPVQSVMADLGRNAPRSKIATEQALNLSHDRNAQCVFEAEARARASPVCGRRGYDDAALYPSLEAAHRNPRGARDSLDPIGNRLHGRSIAHIRGLVKTDMSGQTAALAAGAVVDQERR